MRPLDVYHGKVGRELSVEMSVKHGPVRLLSVVQTVDGKLQLLMAEGESVAGPILEIGNTNSPYRFPTGARKFMNQWNVHGPAHHCAVGVGHIASKLKKLGALLGMECIQICERPPIKGTSRILLQAHERGLAGAGQRRLRTLGEMTGGGVLF